MKPGRTANPAAGREARRRHLFREASHPDDLFAALILRDEADAPVHGGRFRLESARDIGGLEQPREGQHLGEVAVDQGGGLILASSQDLDQPVVAAAGQIARARSNRRRRKSRHPETPWPETVESGRRPWDSRQLRGNARRLKPTYPRSIESQQRPGRMRKGWENRGSSRWHRRPSGS